MQTTLDTSRHRLAGHRERQPGGRETCLFGHHGSETANLACNCQPRPIEGSLPMGCELNMLGRYADKDVAKITGRKLREVIASRIKSLILFG